MALACSLLAGCTPAPPAAPGAPPSAQSPSATAPSATAPTSTPTQAPEPTRPTQACLAEAAALPLRSQAGQLLMVGVDGGLGTAERRALADHRVGSVVLLGDQSGGVSATRTLTRRLARIHPDAALLVAADQEGGSVQRLTGPGWGRIPSAARQAELTTGQLRRSAAGWGSRLARAGVLLDLAPVADVVPTRKLRTNQPVGRLGRGYGSDPEKVAASTGAVIAGLADAGVAASVKHFPGLGEVVGNTDHTGGVVDRVTHASSAALRPFRAAVSGGVASVMVSSATYQRIDPERQAVFSPKVVGLLREWGYEGVVISDDLGAAVSARAVPAAQRAVRFVAAGGDLVINADPALTAAMAGGIIRRARRDPAFADRVTQSAARVLRLKRDLGLYTCG